MDFTEILTLSKEPARCAKYLLEQQVGEVKRSRNYVPAIPVELRERRILAEEKRIERMRDIKIELKTQNDLLKKILELVNVMTERHRKE